MQHLYDSMADKITRVRAVAMLTDKFQVGNAVTIEPGLYYPEDGYGVRIEDMVYIDDSGARDISDLTFCVAYLFGGGDTPPCPAQGDVDGSTAMNVADLTYYVDFLFGGGPEPPPCL